MSEYLTANGDLKTKEPRARVCSHYSTPRALSVPLRSSPFFGGAPQIFGGNSGGNKINLRKRPYDFHRKALNFLVAGAGFEPTTFGL